MNFSKSLSVAVLLALALSVGVFSTFASADSNSYELQLPIRGIRVSNLSPNGFDVEVRYIPNPYTDLTVGLSYTTDTPEIRVLPDGTQVSDSPYSITQCDIRNPSGVIPVSGSGYIKFHVTASGDCLTSHLSSASLTVRLGEDYETYEMTSAGTEMPYNP